MVLPRLRPGEAAEGSKALNDVRVAKESQAQSMATKIFDSEISTARGERTVSAHAGAQREFQLEKRGGRQHRL